MLLEPTIISRMKSKFRLIYQSLILVGLLITLILFNFSPLNFSSPITPVIAQEETDHFYTTLDSTYTVNTDGNSFVEHLFRIKNLTPEFFISKYGLNIGSNQISQVRVVADGQPLEAEVNQLEAQTQISITFPNKLVGQDKIREFSISYHNPDLAHVNGQVLEVNIPQMADPQHYDQHQIKLITPIKFGRPTRITPEDYQFSLDSQNFVTSYTQLNGRGVSAIFGEEQVFNLTIRYHLDNPTNQPAITQVSLPPDTAFQKLNYQQLQPRPQEIKTDPDGNWIATYYLPANETTEVNVQAQVLIGVEPVNPSLQPQPQPEHLQSQPYWPVNSDQIESIAAKYHTPQAIYHYVVDNLEYTDQDLTQEIERLGAKKTLQQPNDATCQEFTDLFISLARANQIPARRITGYAHSQNSRLRPLSLVTDVLHTWPEYYHPQQKRWMPIDPTWENTTQGVDYFNQFDLNHIVFAINGMDSELPYPAGAYKKANQETKDVKVEFGQEFVASQPQFDVAVQSNKILSIPIPGLHLVQIKNLTGQAWYDLRFDIFNQEKSILDQGQSLSDKNSLLTTTNQQNPDKGMPVSDQTLSPNLRANIETSQLTILPYETKQIPLKIYNADTILVSQHNLDLVLTVPASEYFDQAQAKQSYEFQLSAIHPIQDQLRQPRQLLIMAGVAVILTLAAGSILVFRRRR